MKVPDLKGIIKEAAARQDLMPGGGPVHEQTDHPDPDSSNPVRPERPSSESEDTEEPEAVEPVVPVVPVVPVETPPDSTEAERDERIEAETEPDPRQDTPDPDQIEPVEMEVFDDVETAFTDSEQDHVRVESALDQPVDGFQEEEEQWQTVEPVPTASDEVDREPPEDMRTNGDPNVLETIKNPFKELRAMSTPLSRRTQNALYLILAGLMARPLMTAISSLMNNESGIRGFLEQIGNLGAIGCTGLGVIMLLSDCLTSRGDETGSEAAMSMLLRVAMVFVIVIMLVVLMQLVGQVRLPDPTGTGAGGLLR